MDCNLLDAICRFLFRTFTRLSHWLLLNLLALSNMHTYLPSCSLYCRYFHAICRYHSQIPWKNWIEFWNCNTNVKILLSWSSLELYLFEFIIIASIYISLWLEMMIKFCREYRMEIYNAVLCSIFLDINKDFYGFFLLIASLHDSKFE